MKTVGIIPSRYASTRLHAKPLLKIAGKTMIQRVYEQCLKSNLDEVWVATDNAIIFDIVNSFGGKALMTSSNHKNGTERIAEATQTIEADIIINIQGDEPFIQEAQINLVIDTIKNSNAAIATLALHSNNESIFAKSSVVKVVFDKNNDALFFSRSAIPFHRNAAAEHSFYKHIGIYGFQKETLLKLVQLPASPLETKESLEQLRWLENGYKIKVALTDCESISIDTAEDWADAEKYALANKL